MIRNVGIVVSLCALVLPVSPLEAADAPFARLRSGDAVFWRGSSDDLATKWSCAEDFRCYEYPLEIVGAGSLRVAIDITDGDDGYYLRLLGPSGDQIDAANPPYSAELTTRAGPGTYTAVVETGGTNVGPFRMRAKLEEVRPPRARPVRPLLPNLRLLPPFKLTFKSAALLGSTSGCTEDEFVEHQPVRCLRFSLGPANFGDGPLELRYEALEGVGQKGTIYQRVHYSDGSTRERVAGEFEYHTTHGHFHHAGFGSLELWRVTDPKRGRIVRAGDGPKQGFCMAPYMIVNWRRIDNDPAFTAEADCLETTPATGAHMGLDKGWADIYEWNLPGNYVEFGQNSDGLYLVRSMTDAGRDILETNEADNWGYAYIRVEGDRIEVLERGYGRSPWDPNKMVQPRWLKETI